jgi:predicted Zn-ribbon and HTH transcriptional regulator
MRTPTITVEYCEQCNHDFRSTAQAPERCSRCGSPKWNQAKKYTQPLSLFNQEADAD